jgi:hypothetical protein
MRGSEGTTKKGLADEIRRQFDSPSAQRYYRSHPLFHAEDRLPDQLDQLLFRLDEVSGRQGRDA